MFLQLNSSEFSDSVEELDSISAALQAVVDGVKGFQAIPTAAGLQAVVAAFETWQESEPEEVNLLNDTSDDVAEILRSELTSASELIAVNAAALAEKGVNVPVVAYAVPAMEFDDEESADEGYGLP